jgi:copper homeostasis protein
LGVDTCLFIGRLGRRLLLEVIVQSVEDARSAEAGGADRLEVVREIQRDGLTPPIDLVQAIACESRLPLRVMIRESDGFAMHDLDELERLRRAMTAVGAVRVDGVVVGFARDGDLDLDAMHAVLSAAPMVHVTLHRVFDSLRDPLATIPSVRELGQIDRILTSGGPGDWMARADRLRAFSTAAGPAVTILAGGGIDETAIEILAGARCVTEIHVGRAARTGGEPTAPVSADRVRRLKEIAAR